MDRDGGEHDRDEDLVGQRFEPAADIVLALAAALEPAREVAVDRVARRRGRDQRDDRHRAAVSERDRHRERDPQQRDDVRGPHARSVAPSWAYVGLMPVIVFAMIRRWIWPVPSKMS